MPGDAPTSTIAEEDHRRRHRPADRATRTSWLIGGYGAARGARAQALEQRDRCTASRQSEPNERRSRPPMIVSAIGLRSARPRPCRSRAAAAPAPPCTVVITIGRRRIARGAGQRRRAPDALGDESLRRVDEQDRVVDRDAGEHDQPEHLHDADRVARAGRARGDADQRQRHRGHHGHGWSSDSNVPASTMNTSTSASSAAQRSSRSRLRRAPPLRPRAPR